MKIKNDFECEKCYEDYGKDFVCLETIYAEPGEKEPKITRCPLIENFSPRWKLVKKTKVKG